MRIANENQALFLVQFMRIMRMRALPSRTLPILLISKRKVCSKLGRQKCLAGRFYDAFAPLACAVFLYRVNYSVRPRIRIGHVYVQQVLWAHLSPYPMSVSWICNLTFLRFFNCITVIITIDVIAIRNSHLLDLGKWITRTKKRSSLSTLCELQWN